MTLADLAKSMAESVKRYVDKRLSEIREEVKSLPVKNGIDGKDGINGKDGADGKNGEDGRDALSIEILPGIVQGKAYHRGTFACWKGGLVRATRNTDPMLDDDATKCGWAVVVNGLQSVQFHQDQNDPRSVKFVAETTEKQVVFEARVPTMDYKGVYQESDYRLGDTVTYAGSLWIAQKDGPSGKPGEPDSDGWKLGAKRGRDGKDGRNGIDMTKAVKL